MRQNSSAIILSVPVDNCSKWSHGQQTLIFLGRIRSSIANFRSDFALVREILQKMTLTRVIHCDLFCKKRDTGRIITTSFLNVTRVQPIKIVPRFIDTSHVITRTIVG